MTRISQAHLIDEIQVHAARQNRTMVAISGPPGSGKSTLAAKLADNLDLPTAVVPMDGFHLDNAELISRGLLERKGAPQTFAVSQFVDLVRTLRTGSEVPFPTFDRDADQTVPNGGTVSPQTRVVLVEGNYLLLDDPPWSELAPLFDVTVSIHVAREDLQARLIARWCHQGMSLQDATVRAVSNDMENVDIVSQNARKADFILQT